MTRASMPVVVMQLAAVVCLAGLGAGVTPLWAGASNAGSDLYLEGQGADVQLARGEVRLPARRFPCARCHGDDGLGSREGGTLMPPIVWNRLSIPTAERAAYDQSSLIRAITAGIDASGEPLGELMPRYTSDAATLDALVSYIRQLDDLQRTGITPAAVRVRAPGTAQRRAGFTAAIGAFNRQGGSYGRHLEVVDSGETLLAADDFFEILAAELPALLRKTLLDTLREDGQDRVSLTGAEPGPSVLYELRQAGLTFDTDSRAVLMDAPADADRLSSHVVYASYMAAGPYLADWLENDTPMVLAGIGEDAIRWALNAGLGEEAANGFLLGMLLGDALLASGRDLTHAALDREFRALDLGAYAFVSRSHAD